MSEPRAQTPKGSFASEERQAYWLMLPAVLLLLTIGLYPLVTAAGLSLQRSILVFGESRFVGFENVRFLLSDGRFGSALGRTFYFTGVAVGLELLLALPLALLMHRTFPGRGLLRATVLIPWAVPTVVSAKLWAWLFNAEQGLFSQLVSGGAVNWLGSPALALHAAIVVDVWKTTPFVALLLLAGRQSIPDSLYRAASLDGASTWQTFRWVTLPLLRPAIVLALLFRGLDAFRVFDAIYVLTEGGPANTTETLSVYAFKTLMRTGDFGYGATLSLATFLAALALSGVILLFGGRYLKGER